VNTPLQKAAQSMIDRWESPDWKDTPHTAHYIAELRKALNAEIVQSVAPDLFDAAKLVLAWYEAENDFTKEPDFYKRVEMCRVSEVALRAAIAKALGEKNGR